MEFIIYCFFLIYYYMEFKANQYSLHIVVQLQENCLMGEGNSILAGAKGI